MDFDTWLKDNGFDPAAVSDGQRKKLLATWKQDVANGGTAVADSLEDLRAKADAEDGRRKKIKAQIEREMDPALNCHLTTEDRNHLKAIGEKAMDEKWPLEKFELEMLRARRPDGRYAIQRFQEPDVSDTVIEAAVCRGAGLQEMEKMYDKRVLEAMDRHYPRGLSLCDLVLNYARRAGYTGHSFKANPEAAMRAARQATNIQAAGSWGPSTQGASIGSMLAAVANKFFRAAFENVEASWRPISAIRNAPDFKQITTWSLTGDLTFKKVPPGGEIQHGQTDGTSYTNQVDTYARMLGIDRRDLINDDIGAFASVARRLGRGGAIALNKLFWGVFLNNSSFFTSGRNNLITGAGTTLQLSQLDVLNQKFLLQTDPDGNILGVRPRILLVPPALWATATTLMASTAMQSGATTAPGIPSTNIFAGMFTVVSSAYMQDSTLTGNSATAWYLIADPNDLAVIEVAFLNGQETPTVEPVDSDPSMLGQGFRGYYDVGVAFQEYRAGAKSAGA